MLVEDSSIIREIVMHILEKQLKVRVVSFESAESAIQNLDLYEPDVILMDYNLNSSSPLNMTGLQFLKKMKLLGRSNSVIMMSGQRDKKVTSEILKSGAVNYLSKEDEGFMDNLVIQVKLILDVLEIDETQKEQKAELSKRIFRISAFILIPLVIVMLSLYYLL
jgi:DNA-binding NtrC family response regulator